MTDNDDFRGVYALIDLCLSRCQPEAPMQLTAKAREWKALKAVVDAALSAQSTGSGGVAAEPVAMEDVAFYAWRCREGEGSRQRWASAIQHKERYPGGYDDRSVTAAYEAATDILALLKHPPVAAEPVAGNLRDALAPFAAAWQSCQDLGDQGAGYVQDDQDAWVSGNRNGGAHPLFKFGDLRRAAEALAAAPTPPAGGGETNELIKIAEGVRELVRAVWWLLDNTEYGPEGFKPDPEDWSKLNEVAEQLERLIPEREQPSQIGHAGTMLIDAIAAASALPNDGGLAKITASDGDEIDASYIGGAAMQVIGTIAEAAGFWGRPEIEAALKYFGGEGWTKGQEILPFVMAEHVEPSPASPAGDLNSLSAGATQPTVNVGVLCGNNSDYVVLAVEPKGEPVRKMRLSIGGADVLLAELGGLLYGEPTPAAPRKGPSEEEIAALIYAQLSGNGMSEWRVRSVSRQILALLTPADRGETQAVGDGWQPIVEGMPDEKTVLGGWHYSALGFKPFWMVEYEKASNRSGAMTHYLQALLPSPDQNRGEPDQGGEAR